MSRRSKKLADILHNDPHAYKRKFTISLEFAIVRGTTNRPGWARSSHNNKLKKPVFVHYEFMAPQGDRDSRADIVAHYNAAKMFLDAESRPAKFWTDEAGQEWTGWHHTFQLAVNDQLLDDLYDRPLLLRVWDTRDKVSTRARFDRPRTTVEDTISNKSTGKQSMAPNKSRKSTASGGGKKRNTVAKGTDTKSKHRASAGPDSTGTESESSDEDEERNHHDAVLEEIQSTAKFATAEDGQGTMLQLWLHKFFVRGTTCVANAFNCAGENSALSSVTEIRVRMSFDQPLLVPRQIARLNPLEVTLLEAGRMPSTPISHEDLAEKCHKPYIKVGFHGNVELKVNTTSTSRGPTLSFNQSLIVLTGRYSLTDLEAFYRGEGLPIELHDRDRLPHDASLDVLYNGMDEEFADFNAAVGVSLSTAEAAPKAPTESYDPYGITRVPLVDLLAGARVLTLECPVLPCRRKDPPAIGSDGQPAQLPMHPGHYVEWGTYVKVRIEVTNAHRHAALVAMTAEEEAKNDALKLTEELPSGNVWHAVFIDTEQIIHALVRRVRDVCDAATSNGDLVAVHVAPHGDRHILILEGSLSAVQQCWSDAVAQGDLTARPLFNSGLSVPQPLYRDLGPGVHSFALEDSVEQLLRDPHIYVKDGRGWDCLEGLSQLHDLASPDALMTDVYDDGRLPSTQSLLNMNRTFGIEVLVDPMESLGLGGDNDVFVTRETETHNDHAPEDNEHAKKMEAREANRTITWSRGPDGKPWKPKRTPINFVKRNVEAVSTASTTLNVTADSGPASTTAPVYMYANQTLNSREVLRRSVIPQLPTGTTRYSDGKHTLESTEYGRPDDCVQPQKWDTTLRETVNAPPLHGSFDLTNRKSVSLSRDSMFLDTSPTTAPDLFRDVIPRTRSPVKWDDRHQEFDGRASHASIQRSPSAPRLASSPTAPFKYTEPLPNIKH
eukprot:m.8192 g.8192  ORF g.8192 m.8192 type:complete len:947 (+) comp2512_c0_seq1:73-2913(+)